MKQLLVIALFTTLILTQSDNKLSPGITDGEILIGNIQDLSGPLKELGFLIPAGSQLYFDYVNENGGVHGRKIRMIIEDHQYNPQKAVVAAKKLIEKDQVFALYNVIGTSPAEAIRPVLEESGVPLVAPATMSGTMSDLSRQAGDLIFHTDAGYDVQSNVLVNYILEQNANAKIGVVYQDDDYGANVLKGIAEAEERHGITIQKEAYQRGAADFQGQTMNLVRGKITDVIIAGIVREPVTIMKTAQAMKYSPRFFGHAPTVDARVTLMAGEAGEGYTACYFAFLWDSDEPGPTLYRKLCEKADIPKEMVGIYNFYGFATAQVLVEGLERAGKSPTRKKLVKALETLNKWESGSYPPITFNPNDHAGVEKVMLLQVQDGKQVAITGWLE